MRRSNKIISIMNTSKEFFLDNNDLNNYYDYTFKSP